MTESFDFEPLDAPTEPIEAPEPSHVSDPVVDPDEHPAPTDEAPSVFLVVKDGLPEGIEPPFNLAVAGFEDVEVPAEGVEVSAKHAEALGIHPYFEVEREDAE